MKQWRIQAFCPIHVMSRKDHWIDALRFFDCWHEGMITVNDCAEPQDVYEQFARLHPEMDSRWRCILELIDQ